MPKVVVCINSLVSTTQPAYSNHIQYFYRLGKDFPDLEVCLVNPSRMSIDRCRNLAAEITLEKEFDYLLFLDDDVLIPHKDSLQKLIAADGDIVCGDVLIRGYPFDHMVFRYDGPESRNLKPISEYPPEEIEISPVIPVDAVGFSYCLIKASLLQRMPKPFFVTGPMNTEDIYFCLKAKKFLPETTIKVDTSVTCAHILWAEAIDKRNKPFYKKYYEDAFPDSIPQKEDAEDRGDKYLEMVKGPDTVTMG